MLTLLGDILISNDIPTLEKCRYTHKIIFIGEADRETIDNYRGISGALFMPPYDAVMQEMDGNIAVAKNIYINHLLSAECQEYIALIFRALYEGKKILLYLSKDESDLMYSHALLEFLFNGYGLSVSRALDVSAVYNSNYSDIVADLLYLYDLFSLQEYFMIRSSNLIAPNIIQKLVYEMNPYVPERTLEAYQLYFSNLIRLSKEAGKPISNGLVFEEK